MAPKALGWPQTPEFATARSQEVFQPLCGFALMTLERDSFWLPHFRLALGQSAGSHPTFFPTHSSKRCSAATSSGTNSTLPRRPHPGPGRCGLPSPESLKWVQTGSSKSPRPGPALNPTTRRPEGKARAPGLAEQTLRPRREHPAASAAQGRGPRAPVAPAPPAPARSRAGFRVASHAASREASRGEGGQAADQWALLELLGGGAGVRSCLRLGS